MKKFFAVVLVLVLLATISIVTSASNADTVTPRPQSSQAQEPIIIDHTCTDLTQVPAYWIEQAKAQLRLSYGHTSHGSQPITGMDILMADLVAGDLYAFNTNGAVEDDVLSLADRTPAGDLGNPDRVTWAARTREYLNDSGSDRNVVVWSWCGQASSADEEDIETYLNLMSGLEADFPDVTFVYMTGHLDGGGIDGNLYRSNNQIRQYCLENNKILFDFADIESYDPDGNYYPDERDSCGWCSDWCDTHECPSCISSCAHSHCFNCYNKGKAFWWMLARIAGWEGPSAAAADLSLSYKAVSPVYADYDDQVDYTVVIQSATGPLTSTIVFSDVIQAGLVYVPGSLTATTGVVHEGPAAMLSWSGLLTPTPIVTISYAAEVAELISGTGSLVLPQTIENTAYIAVSGQQPITRTAILRVSWQHIYLPIAVKNSP